MTQIKIRSGAQIIDINIICGNTRYVDVIVNEDLSVVMKVPVGMCRNMIEEYIRLNKDYIVQEYEKKRKRNHQTLPDIMEMEQGRIIYKNGLTLPFLGGMNMKLSVRYIPKGQDTNLYLSKNANGDRRLSIRTDNQDQRFLRYCVMRYYKKCTLEIARKRAVHFGSQMHLKYNDIRIMREPKRKLLGFTGIAYKNIEIQNQKTLWGSCGRTGDLKFDWKLVMLPLEVIDYVVVHELAHLKKMNHSAAFWTEIEKIIPEYRECWKWLHKHGKEYEIF